MAYTFTVRKDNWTPSRPWTADVTDGDTVNIKNWGYGYKTRKSLVAEILAVAPEARIVFAKESNQ